MPSWYIDSNENFPTHEKPREISPVLVLRRCLLPRSLACRPSRAEFRFARDGDERKRQLSTAPPNCAVAAAAVAAAPPHYTGKAGIDLVSLVRAGASGGGGGGEREVSGA